LPGFWISLEVHQARRPCNQLQCLICIKRCRRGGSVPPWTRAASNTFA